MSATTSAGDPKNPPPERLAERLAHREEGRRREHAAADARLRERHARQ